LYVFLDSNLRRMLYRTGIHRGQMDRRVGAVYAYAFDVPGVDLDEVESSYRMLAECLAKMTAMLDARGVPLVVLGIPSRFRISDDPVDNERGFAIGKIRIDPLDRVAESCTDLGIPFVDLRPPLRAERRRMFAGHRSWDDLYIPLDFVHLNSVGLRIAAVELLRMIEELERGDGAVEAQQSSSSVHERLNRPPLATVA
jgi:hypothetical protein